MKPKRLVVVRFRRDRQRWEVDHVNPAGSTYRRTRRLFETEEQALAYANTMAPRLTAEAPPVMNEAITLEAAFTRYFQAKARKRSLEADRRIAEHLKAEFGATTPIRNITSAKISAYRERRLAAKSIRRKDTDGTATRLSAASVNRPLALLRHLLRMAHQEWEAIPLVPRVRLEREPQGRLRWLEPDEEHRMLEACRASTLPHLADLVTVAMETGMRRSEVENLTWDRVDLSRGVIKLETTKSGKRREIPMRSTVYATLVVQQGREARVWPPGSTRAAFEDAVKAARLDSPFRFHDLRHHFASWFVMNGGAVTALQQVLGHATLAMTMRYAHLSPDHLRGEMAKTERPTGTVVEPNAGTTGGQSAHDDAEVVDFPRERRGSSVAEQLIRNQ